MDYNSILDDAVGYWPLQETSGIVAVDETGSGHDGVLNGMTFDSQSVAGPTSWLPSALRTDGGTLQYVEIPDHVDLRGGDKWTIAAWIETTGSVIPHLLSKAVGNTNRDYISFWHSSYGPRWGMEKNDVSFFGGSASGQFPGGQNQWLHVAASYDNATGATSLYVNGVLAVSETNADKSSASTAALRMFVPGYSSTKQKAALAGVGMWSRILSMSEIAVLFSGVIETWPGFAEIGEVVSEGNVMGEISLGTGLVAGSVISRGQ